MAFHLWPCGRCLSGAIIVNYSTEQVIKFLAGCLMRRLFDCRTDAPLAAIFAAIGMVGVQMGTDVMEKDVEVEFIPIKA